MGAWGHEPFANDDALDWLSNLDDAVEWTPVTESISRFRLDVDYPEAPECSEAIAAAAVVAAGCDRQKDALPEEVESFLSIVALPPRELRVRVLDALQRIETRSELRDLWAETELFDNWCQTIVDLKKRIQSCAT